MSANDLNARLIAGVLHHDINEVTTCLNSGAHVHTSCNIAMQCAAYYGYSELVSMLIQHDSHCGGSLECAAKSGHLEIVKLLLNHGVDVHEDDDYALQVSAEKGYFDIVKLLLEHDIPKMHALSTALSDSIFNNDGKIIKLLSDHGALFSKVRIVYTSL